MATSIDGVSLAMAESREAAHDVLRALVADIAGLPDASEVSIVRRCPDCGGPHGRPVVMDPPAARDVQVSLSHPRATRRADAQAHPGSAPRSWHVVAATFGRRVGIDAEPVDTDERRLAAIRAMLPAAESDDTLRAWTRAEAVVKADGRGLRVRLEDLSLQHSGTALTASLVGTARRYVLHDAALDDQLVVSLAVEA